MSGKHNGQCILVTFLPGRYWGLLVFGQTVSLAIVLVNFLPLLLLVVGRRELVFRQQKQERKLLRSTGRLMGRCFPFSQIQRSFSPQSSRLSHLCGDVPKMLPSKLLLVVQREQLMLSNCFSNQHACAPKDFLYRVLFIHLFLRKQPLNYRTF